MTTTTETKTLLEFLLDLLNDEDDRAAFQADPEKALHDAGLEDVSVEDIKELLPVVFEHCHPSYAAHYEQHCDEYDDDSDSSDDSDDDSDCDDDEDGGHHGGHGHHGSDPELDKVITHLNAVTANYYISNDTIYNNEFTTNIWNTGDGDVDFSQVIDVDQNSVSGDGGVLIDGDNSAPVVTGDGAVVGDGNQVSGQGSTTAFGSGDANSGDLSADNGSALVFGAGTGAGAQSNTDSHDDNSVNDSGNVTDSGNTDNSVHDSNNTDNSDQDNSVTDNHTEDSSLTDSHDVDVDTGDGSPVAVEDAPGF